MRKIACLLLFLIFMTGCSNIHVGGSGSLGGVSGGGGVSIPIPKK